MKRKAGEKKHWFDFLLRDAKVEGGASPGLKAPVIGVILIMVIGIGGFLAIGSTFRCGRHCQHEADPMPWQKASEAVKDAIL